MKYTIQSNIPIPERRGGRAPDPSSFQGKIRALKVGQSIFTKGSSGAQNWPKDRKFTARTLNGGVRIWRIK